MLEARPYLRAMEGLAGMLWRMGRREESIARYREMLRLNPGDNQGMRYVLLELLLELEREPEAEALLAANKEDTSAAFEYTRALLLFRRSPKSAAASRRLRAALAGNPHVPAYLTLAKRVPSELPDTIGWGDESEAAAYAAQFLNYWRRTPGAIAWLTETRQAEAGAPTEEPGPAPRARHRHRKVSA
jgi:tetratricopeptide (TPR) repeat protein